MSPKRQPSSIHLSWDPGAPPPELDPAELSAALATILVALGHADSQLSVLFADDARLRALNRDHRGLDRATDVLSWSYRDPGPPPLLGELALSLERATAQARENGWPLRTEVLRLLAHGCAHLAGYDHESTADERKMKALEVRLLAAVGLEGIYPEDAPRTAGRRTVRRGAR